MKLTEQSNWFLSSLELTLCLQLLGQDKRTVLPVVKTDQPIYQRMLDAFLHLAELGLLEAADDGYRPTELLSSRLLPVSDPEYILTLPDGDVPTAVYFRKGTQTLLQAQGEEKQTCAISDVSRSELPEFLAEQLQKSIARRPCLEIRAADGIVREWFRFSEDGAEHTECLSMDVLQQLLAPLI